LAGNFLVPVQGIKHACAMMEMHWLGMEAAHPCRECKKDEKSSFPQAFFGTHNG
jgi:hypothetical protein